MMRYIKIIGLIMCSIVIAISCAAFNVYAATPASLFLTKSVSKLSVGQHITLDVKAQSLDQSINAVSATVLFPSDKLNVTSVSRNDSILNIWTHDPTIDGNQISFEGVILNPGYQGSSANIVHITFKVKKEGRATVSFKDGSLLANDGRGTNIAGKLIPVSFNIDKAEAVNNAQPPTTEMVIANPPAPVVTQNNPPAPVIFMQYPSDLSLLIHYLYILIIILIVLIIIILLIALFIYFIPWYACGCTCRSKKDCKHDEKKLEDKTPEPPYTH